MDRVPETVTPAVLVPDRVALGEVFNADDEVTHKENRESRNQKVEIGEN
jgi:hypothetical protein